MSLRRRLEMILGGPARPFPLTVHAAHELANAIDYYIDGLKAGAAELEPDPEIDAEVFAGLRSLQARLYQHAGFDRLARKTEEANH